VGRGAAAGLRRFVLILTWLPAYDRKWLRFDVIAGATICGLLILEMIVCSVLAGLPPQAGLYTALASLAAYAIFGTCRHFPGQKRKGDGARPRGLGS
jgi:sulfate permease, SulP family